MSKTKIILIRIALSVILFSNLVFISYQSTNSAEESDGMSTKVTEVILTATVSDFKEKSEPEQKKMIDDTNGIVRECAHTAEFVPVGITFFGLLITFKKALQKKLTARRFYPSCALCTCLFGLLYAVFDESHQIFVPGRGFQILDIFLDTLGVTVGVLITLLAVNIFERERDRIRRYTPAGGIVDRAPNFDRRLAYSLKE